MTTIERGVTRRPYPTTPAASTDGGHDTDGRAGRVDVFPVDVHPPLVFTWPHCELVTDLSPFLLRELACCDPCGSAMAPMAARAGLARSYKCPQACHQQLVDAQVVEQTVVEAARRHVGDFAGLHPRVYASALRHLLIRVCITPQGRLVLRWNENE
ncbi:hypothetical protein I0C86_40995 [Plantactinospora sp. S1510]|uniref:Recombinase zinc beta ribbon domain-containing protein n=1 Tax=Plantactinospora alkalitolerans TaxID=2789879 RepID=A0ABS0H9S8_9ACTN|nr:hypothetical protein [Plantactinospora alkalitolerans]MBF9135229.1 hypothetical protein [Plantactinospora alkalitolerans]